MNVSYIFLNVRLISRIATTDAMASEIGKDIQIPLAPKNLDNKMDNGITIISCLSSEIIRDEIPNPKASKAPE